MDSDRWVLVEINNYDNIAYWTLGLFPIIAVGYEDTSSSIPDGIMHISIKTPLQPRLASFQRVSFLVQEHNIPILMRCIQINHLGLIKHVPDGYTFRSGNTAKKGVHGVQVVINVRDNAPSKRVKLLLSGFSTLRGPLNAVTIAGTDAADFDYAQHIERSIQYLPTEPPIWEVIMHQYWLKVRGDDMVCQNHIAARGIFLGAGDLRLSWTKRNPKAWLPSLLNHYQSFQIIAETGIYLNLMICEIEARTTLTSTRIGAPLLTNVYNTTMRNFCHRLTSTRVAYFNLLVGLHRLYCGSILEGDQHISNACSTFRSAWEVVNHMKLIHQLPLFRSCMRFCELVEPLLNTSPEDSKKVMEYVDDFHKWIRGKLKPFKLIIPADAIPRELKERGILDLLPRYVERAEHNRKFNIFCEFPGFDPGDYYLL